MLRPLVAGVLAALAAGAQEMPAFPPGAKTDFKWIVPKVRGEAPVVGVQEADGIPMRLHVVVSGEKPAELVRHFVAHFRKSGLYVPPASHLSQAVTEPVVVGIDPARELSFTAILQPNRDGTTTVLLGESNYGARRAEPLADGVPLFPGASGALRSQSEGARLVSYGAAAPASEVEGFYRELLSRSGYVEREPNRYARGGDEISVRATAERGRSRVVVVQRKTAREESDPLR